MKISKLVGSLFVLLVFVLAAPSQNLSELDREVAYYAPIRYAIVYDWIFNDERRIEVLIAPKTFSRANLIRVFNLVKARYPDPIRLSIDVHTSLATIETPEEREMLRDSEDTRFSKIANRFKRATFTRYDGGREALIYSVGRTWPYKDELVVLVDKEVK